MDINDSGRLRRRRITWLAIAAGLLLVGSLIGAFCVNDSDGSEQPRNAAADNTATTGTDDSTEATETLIVGTTVDNRVTNDGAMVEDTHPAYLSDRPVNFCKDRGCVAGPDMHSGYELRLNCWTTGERTTNGNDGSPFDDDNPGLRDSTTWFGAIDPSTGDEGFISEVWLVVPEAVSLLPSC